MEVWQQIKEHDWSLVSRGLGGWPQRLWKMNKHYHHIGYSGGGGIAVLDSATPPGVPAAPLPPPQPHRDSPDCFGSVGILTPGRPPPPASARGTRTLGAAGEADDLDSLVLASPPPFLA